MNKFMDLVLAQFDVFQFSLTSLYVLEYWLCTKCK